jgi:radical SAM protein (TIGR01212 family)
MQDFRFPWGHHRRFNSYNEYFKKTFGQRVQKLSIDAGFTCPNRDGTVGRGGCTFCNNDAFNPSYCQPEKSIRQQIEEGKQFHAWRYRRAIDYLAYFQAFSNTFAPLEHLKKIYDEALAVDGIIGLVIGTRPDCIDDEKLDYFQELSKNHYLIIEYGIESCYDETLERINRGHTFGQSVEAIEKTTSRGIKTGAHIIFGLPGETTAQMMAEAEILSKLPLNTLKFHQLQIVKNTSMALEYLNQPENFTFFSLDEYIELIVNFLERLNPKIVIERFAGEVPPRFLAGPGWGTIRYDQILQKIENRMEERETWQGRLYF